MREQEREIARFFDCCEKPSQKKMNQRMSRKARSELVKAVRSIGLGGRTVLEVGSGAGELSRELVRAGAAKAIGLDLAEGNLEEARKRADEEGLSDRLEYRLSNGATDPLTEHDVVILDKVICCYPNWRELVGNTSSAAKSLYAFVIPRSAGLSGAMVRAFIALQRLILRIMRCGFRPYVHDYRAIHAHLLSQGFERRRHAQGPIWMTAVYSRT